MKVWRIARSLFCLALVASSACVVHRPAPSDLSVLQGTRVRLRSPAPIAVRKQTDSAWTTLGTVTSLYGSLVSAAGDTVVVRDADGMVTSREGHKFRLVRGETIHVVRTPATEMTVARISRGRTAALILIPPALYLLLGLLAVNSEGFWDFPPPTIEAFH